MSLMGDVRAGASGFFSVLTDVVKTSTKELLPVWIKSEVDLQSKDQLDKSTFDPAAAPPRVDETRVSEDAVNSTQRSGVPSAANIITSEGGGGFGVSPGILLAIAGFLVTILVVKKL